MTKAKDVEKTSSLLAKIGDRYSDKELIALARGEIRDQNVPQAIHDFTGKTVRIGAISDPHLGSLYTNPDFMKNAFDVFADRGVDFVTIGGDVTEGMSNRPGHVYELTHVGYDAQKTHAIEAIGQWTDTDIYMIDGNHDRWFIKSAGAIVVKDICDALPNATFLGHDEGDINLSPHVRLKLWHGGDASSYAISYRLQKLIESLTGGEKPEILFAGHVHKMGYFFIRHVHCISTGAIQCQTKWMRGKRIASHTGFWVVEVDINEKGVASLRPEWFPLYV